MYSSCRVLIISLEDDDRELRRRTLAAMLHHGIQREELKGWLFLSAPGGGAGKLMTADRNGQIKRGKLADNIEAAIIRRKPDIVMLDPFVKSHAVGENENMAIDGVIQILTDLAAKYDIAVDAPHHVSKGPADAGNADKGRGASSMVDAGRIVKTLTPMGSDEAKAYGIKEEDRKQYIRLDNGKVNIVRGGGNPDWFRLVGVPIGNGTELYPHGDEVQTVEPWTPPELWANMSVPLLNQILTKINDGLPDGDRYTDASAATDRAAWRVVTELAPAKAEGPARNIIKEWVKNGVLERYTYHSESERKDRNGLRVNDSKRPG
jgi:hypothetical protein